MVGVAQLQEEISEIKSLLNKLNDKDEFISVEQFSERYGLSKSKIYKLTSQKQIPFHRAGERLIYFKKSDVEKWIESGRVEPAAEKVS
jgi:excisionase family DNA binding protein